MKIETKGRELILTRTFNAKRETVFEAFSDCKHLKHWFGPRTWPISYCKMDFRVGGEWHFCLKGPGEGDESWGKCIYQEIKRPERIVYDDYFSDKEGRLNMEMPYTRVTYDFIDEGGKTLLKSTALYPTEADLGKVLEMGVTEGIKETWDRLVEYLDQQK